MEKTSSSENRKIIFKFLSYFHTGSLDGFHIYCFWLFLFSAASSDFMCHFFLLDFSTKFNKIPLIVIDKEDRVELRIENQAESSNILAFVFSLYISNAFFFCFVLIFSFYLYQICKVNQENNIELNMQ